MTALHKVVIVGGGLGGASCAVALHHRGIPVEVFERAPALTEVGAGVHLSPNSLRVLEHAGLLPALEQEGSPGESLAELCRLTGERVFPAEGMGGQGMHRADLLDILVGALPRHLVHTGYEATGVTQNADHATVTFRDRDPVSADIVIGADGIKSVVRDAVLPPSKPTSSGYLVYRGLIEHSANSQWPADLHRIWMGYGRHLVTFPTRGDKHMLTFVAFIPTVAPLADPLAPEQVQERLHTEFAGWDPMIASIISEIGACLRLEVFDREIAPSWVHGRVAMLGDAVHAMQPHLSQGANQAIEDAGALGVLLEHADANNPAPMLKAYESLRMKRASTVQRMSRRQGLFYDSNGWDPEIVTSEGRSRREFYSWLYDYDVVSAAAELVS